MSRSLNKVILIGNLGADPEVRSTSNGSRVATLSVATSRQWKNQSGREAGEDRVAPRGAVEQQGLDARRHRREVLQEGRQGLHRGQHRVPLVAGPRGPDAVHHRDHRARADPALRPERWRGVLVRAPSKVAAGRPRPRPRARSRSRISPRRSTPRTTTCRSERRGGARSMRGGVSRARIARRDRAPAALVARLAHGRGRVRDNPPGYVPAPVEAGTRSRPPQPPVEAARAWHRSPAPAAIPTPRHRQTPAGHGGQTLSLPAG